LFLQKPTWQFGVNAAVPQQAMLLLALVSAAYDASPASALAAAARTDLQGRLS
jgi:hypothetical protein